MDPLSITASATALVSASGKLLKLLNELYGTIEDAPLLLASITSECSIVYTSLGVLQDLESRKAKQLQSDQISAAFNAALTGCALILSVLEKDVQACLRANKSPQDRDAVKKLKLILSKDHLQELVMQLRGQQQALTLLISTLQSRTLDEMQSNFQDNRDILGGLAKHARRLYVESEHTSQADQSALATDSSIEVESIATSTRFAFDNEVIASRTYQKALAYLHRVEMRKAEFDPQDQDAEDITVLSLAKEEPDSDHTVQEMDDPSSQHNQTTTSNEQAAFLAPPSMSSSSALVNKGGVGLFIDRKFDEIWAQSSVRRKYSSKATRKVVFLGDCYVGKTFAIVSTITGNMPTIPVETFFELSTLNTYLDDRPFELKIWDLHGFGDTWGTELRMAAYPNSHVLVLGFDIGNPDSLENMFVENIYEVTSQCSGLPVVLVGFKHDLRDDPKCQLPAGQTPVSYAQGLEAARNIGAVAYVECSAKTRYGLQHLFETITKCCVLGDSDEWNEFLYGPKHTPSPLTRMFRRKSRVDMNPTRSANFRLVDGKREALSPETDSSA